MPKVGVRVDGLMILVLAGAGLAYYAWSKRQALLAAIDPTSHENLAYQGAVELSQAAGVTGGHGGYSYDDHFFAAIDLLNPFNESDIYAEQVWGLQ